MAARPCSSASAPTGTVTAASDWDGPAERKRVRPALRDSGAADDYDPLLDLIGEARYVLLGEASHGTHEFYRERAQITKRLVKEKGFRAVAVEADWPDAYRVNRYVRGERVRRLAHEAGQSIAIRLWHTRLLLAANHPSNSPIACSNGRYAALEAWLPGLLTASR